MSPVPLNGTEAKSVGRQIISLLELDLEMCNNVYGQAPCTAGGGVGEECYNCWTTCVDKDNYSRETKTFSFVPNQTTLPIGYQAYPCMSKHPTITPAEMEIMKGLGSRGACSVEFDDFNHPDHLDPYWLTRETPAGGTFWGRFRARWPFYKERLMRLYTGYAHTPFDKDNLSMRLYFIENMSGPSANGKIKITGKDILKKLDDDRRSAPEISHAETTAIMSEGDQTVNYTFEAGYPLLAGPAYVEIGEEIIRYATKTDTQLLSCTRATWGTEQPDEHDIDSAIQQCLEYVDVNIIDVVYDLLVNFGGIDPVYIPYADWELERDVWLLANDITAIIATPTGIDKSIAEICEQHAINVWWDETTQEVRLKAVSPETLNAEIPAFNDLQNFLEDSVDIRDDDTNQITQLWIYYGVQNAAESLDEPKNFKKLLVARNEEAESPDEYGIPRIRKIYGNWLNYDQNALVRTIIDRILVKSSKNQKKVKFALDAKDIIFWLCDNIVMQSRKTQNAQGRIDQLQVTITKAKEVIPGTRYEFEGAAVPFIPEERYIFITYNDFPDYGDATDDQKRTGFFISDDDNDFPDGGHPYKIS